MNGKLLTPSQRDGVSKSDEECALYYGAELIQECGILLRLNQVVMASAQALFQRFYLACSLKIHSHIWAAGACLLLASKTEEDARKIRDIANVVYVRLCSREGWIDVRKEDGSIVPLDYYGAVGYDWKSNIVSAERHVLRQLGFHVHVEHPHKFILVFMNTIREQTGADDWLTASGQRWHKVLQRAWNYANDSSRGRVVVVEKPETVACACIGLSARDQKSVLPTNWFLAFGSDAVAYKRAWCDILHIYAIAESDIRFEDIAQSGIKRLCLPMRE